jgi:hypothetical protein
MPGKRQLILTSEQRSELENWIKSREKRSEKRRGKIILQIADGRSVREVERLLCVSHTIVQNTAKRYERDGIFGLEDKPRPGRRGSPTFCASVSTGTSDESTSQVPEYLHDAMRSTRETCVRYHRDRDREAAHRRFNEIAEYREKNVGNLDLVALRNRMNDSYIREPSETSEAAIASFCERISPAKADDPRLKLLAVEAELYHARIHQKRENFLGFANYLRQAEQDLAELYPKGVDLEEMPKDAAAVGHSFVAPVLTIPAAALQAAIWHFIGKQTCRDGWDLVLKGEKANREDWVNTGKEMLRAGLALLRRAEGMDRTIHARSDSAFDCAFQIVPEFILDEQLAADEHLKYCDHQFRGDHGKGHLLLVRATLEGLKTTGSLKKASDLREYALRCFSRSESWSGTAGAYRAFSLPDIRHLYPNLKSFCDAASPERGLLESAFAATALEPVKSNCENLKDIAERLGTPNNAERFIRDMVENLLNCVGQFAQIKRVIGTDESRREMLRAGACTAFGILAAEYCHGKLLRLEDCRQCHRSVSIDASNPTQSDVRI